MQARHWHTDQSKAQTIGSTGKLCRGFRPPINTRMSSDSWDQHRRPYQGHIRNIMRLIDRHSELWVTTGDEYHRRSYDRLVSYISDLKDMIKNKESTHTGS